MTAGGEDWVQRSAHFSVILSEAQGAESKDPLNSPESIEHGTLSGFGGSLDSLHSLGMTEISHANSQFLISTPPMMAIPVITRTLRPSPSMVRVVSL